MTLEFSRNWRKSEKSFRDFTTFRSKQLISTEKEKLWAEFFAFGLRNNFSFYLFFLVFLYEIKDRLRGLCSLREKNRVSSWMEEIAGACCTNDASCWLRKESLLTVYETVSHVSLILLVTDSLLFFLLLRGFIKWHEVKNFYEVAPTLRIKVPFFQAFFLMLAWSIFNFFR